MLPKLDKSLTQKGLTEDYTLSNPPVLSVKQFSLKKKWCSKCIGRYYDLFS